MQKAAGQHLVPREMFGQACKPQLYWRSVCMWVTMCVRREADLRFRPQPKGQGT
jgi:hypothetical protein